MDAMSWAKLDDAFPDHPKVIGLSADAFRLHVTAICYAARFETDGAIPAGGLPRIGGTTASVDELVDAGLWDRTPRGWQIHDYLQYNPSRAERQTMRQQAADRQERWRNGRTNGVSNGVTNGTPLPDPLPLPDPDPLTTEANASVGRKSRKRFITDADIERWKANRPDLDVDAFVADYMNWSGSSKHVDKVQGFENQMRLEWKCRQFARGGSNGTRNGTKHRGDDENDPLLIRLRLDAERERQA